LHYHAQSGYQVRHYSSPVFGVIGTADALVYVNQSCMHDCIGDKHMRGTDCCRLMTVPAARCHSAVRHQGLQSGSVAAPALDALVPVGETYAPLFQCQAAQRAAVRHASTPAQYTTESSGEAYVACLSIWC
jgi:hypothetical protein